MNATTSDIGDLGSDVPESDTGSGGHGLQDTLQQGGRGLVRDAKNEVRRMADERKQQAGSLLRDVGDALDQATSALNDKGHGHAARYTGAAADRLKRAGDELPARDLDSIIGQLTAFAHERPAMFVGGMFLAGFGAARFLSTSAERRGAGGGDDGGGTRYVS